MKLQDQFKNPIMRHDLCRNEESKTIEQCVEIAENFAIGFSKYVLSQIYNMTHGDKSGISIEKLLEIYKEAL